MAGFERVPLEVGIDGVTRVFWRLGWNPVPTYGLLVAMAVFGWLLIRHPVGLVLGLVALIPWWKAISLINRNWRAYLSKAETLVSEQGAIRLGVNLNSAESKVVRMRRGEPPFGVTPNREYRISVVYICDTFCAVYQGAILDLPEIEVQLPTQGEEVYFRHISAVNFNPPNLDIVLSNGKIMRQFEVGPEGAADVLGALRAKLRRVSDSLSAKERSVMQSENHATPKGNETSTSVASNDGNAQAEGGEVRYCGLRLSKLRQLLSDASVLDVLVEKLQVPGEPKVLKRLTMQEKTACMETQIDHFRRSTTSVWYGVPTLEVLAASIWRAAEDRLFTDKGVYTKKVVRRQWFNGVSEEDDLRVPVGRWLRNSGYQPHMEIPLGSARVDVLGYKHSTLSSSERLVAVELKNDLQQFKRALNQMSTFAEYANAVYMACTPDFVAEYLDHNEQSTGHWDPDALERKLTGNGLGLLIIEKEMVYEVTKPLERTPSSGNRSNVAMALSDVNLIDC